MARAAAKLAGWSADRQAHLIRQVRGRVDAFEIAVGAAGLLGNADAGRVLGILEGAQTNDALGGRLVTLFQASARERVNFRAPRSARWGSADSWQRRTVEEGWVTQGDAVSMQERVRPGPQRVHGQSVPPRDRRVAPPHAQLISLQRKAGNRAVASGVKEARSQRRDLAAGGTVASSAAAQRSSAPTEGGIAYVNLVVARVASAQKTQPGAVWNAPEDYGAVTDRRAAHTLLGALSKTVGEYASTEIGTVTSQSRALNRALEAQRGRLTGEGALTAEEAKSLDSLSLLYQGFLNNTHRALQEAVKTGLAGLFNPPDLEETNIAIREAMHALFLKPDEDQLKAIREMAETVKEFSDGAKYVAERAKYVAAAIDAVDVAVGLHGLTEKIDELTGPLAKALDLRKTAEQMLTIAKNAGSDGGIEGAADAMQAGVELSAKAAGAIKIGGVGLFSAVPFFGTYWNEYVVPMTKTCLDMVRSLQERSAAHNREMLDSMITWNPTPNGWHPVGPPPVLDPAMYRSIGVTRPMFEYLYLTRQGNQPPMPSEVRKSLMAKRSALEGITGSEIELEPRRFWSPGSWFNREAKDLPGWVNANIKTVWAAYLGAAGR